MLPYVALTEGECHVIIFDRSMHLGQDGPSKDDDKALFSSQGCIQQLELCDQGKIKLHSICYAKHSPIQQAMLVTVGRTQICAA